MENREYYYVRVSSKGQNLARQIERVKSVGATDTQIIQEKESGKDVANRPAYIYLRDVLLREGDTITVCSIDRLGRNKQQIKEELEAFKRRGIRVKVLDIPTTLMDYPKGQEWVCDMVNNILIEVLGAMAEHERETIRERQAEGIKAAQKEGKVKFGRPTAEKPKNWDKVYRMWKDGEITAVKAMEMTGLKKNTFYKFVNAEEDTEK